MIMYYQTKFGCKRISSSKYTLEIVIFFIIPAFAMTLTFKIVNQSFCMTLWLIRIHQNTKCGNKMYSALADILWTNINTLTLRCDPDLECSNKHFHMTLWHLMMYHQFKFGWQGINSSENIAERVIFFIIWALAVTPTLKTATTTKYFCVTLWLMMLHHHIKFGNKMFCDSEDIPTNIHWHFAPSLWPWPWTQ